ncbi:MAG: hypothetical protein JNL80_08085 [Phycisphaerae bacterium]|jgi:hypothetical protein|nr:hypothetical protein [Phycisphaerae bacterium]
MSTVCVLTPMVIASWPAISAAVAGVAAAMGFTVIGPETVEERVSSTRRVETDVPHSEIVEEVMERGQSIRIQRDDVIVTFGRDERGTCTVCVTGEKHSKSQLEAIGQEIAGRLVQQFAYHKLMTELNSRHYRIVEEQVGRDESIRVRVRLDR